MYLLKRVEVWAHNRLNHIVKTPKVQFVDPGLLSTLMDLTAETVQQDRTRFGLVLEHFFLLNSSSILPPLRGISAFSTTEITTRSRWTW